jgi:hypothetical protein
MMEMLLPHLLTDIDSSCNRYVLDLLTLLCFAVSIKYITDSSPLKSEHVSHHLYTYTYIQSVKVKQSYNTLMEVQGAEEV